MAIKMNDLVKLTDTAKSTILYYVKESLLPEPQKPKPNLHLYDESCVEIIKFIKYLQKHFNTSISELKEIMQRADLNSDRGFEAVLETLDIIMGSAHQNTHTFEQVCSRYALPSEHLSRYLEEGLLFQRDGFFTDKDLEILEMLLNLEKVGIKTDALRIYVEHAKALAAFEVNFAKKVLLESENKNETIKALFDTTLILKPYLFNMHALKSYQESEKTL
jgi:DNA-binding transcriptional MerR regulator